MVPGDSTRPVTDRVKEALFNILGSEVAGCTFLDLFAGTGSVGIEALSRGAHFAQFYDSHPKAIETIQKNLSLTGLSENAGVLQVDALSAITRKADRRFDYIYIAPPQYHQLWEKAVLTLDANADWLVEDGWVVVQIDPQEYLELELHNLSEFDSRKYSNTMLVFYERIAP